jgi:hypothetical protein
MNYSEGAPGSFFNVTGGGFPANQTASVSVNGTSLGILSTNSSGGFTFTLTTTNADEGIYNVSVRVNPSAMVRFALDASASLKPQEGNYPSFAVPPGIAITQEIYLPLVIR